jgi:hypothetical protein
MLITTFSYIFPIKITVAAPPEVPNTPNPSNNSTAVSINTDLSWLGDDPDGDKVTYDVYFGNNNSPPLIEHNNTVSKYNPVKLKYNMLYYWRIIAWDNNGSSTSGPLWHFTTELENQPPIVPNSPSPANGSTGVLVNVDLSWSGGDLDPGDTVTFDVYFGSSSDPPQEGYTQSELTYDPGSLTFNTSYYWRIVAWDNHGASTVGPLWNFTTELQNQPPVVPSSPSPANGSSDESVNVDLSWSGGDPDPGDSVTYDVYFGTSSSPSKESDNQSGSSYDLSTLAFNTSYYWKIVAWDEQDASTVGPLWSFTTGTQTNQPPNIPSNPTPSNGFLGASIDTNLSWIGGDPDGDLVTYDVYFGTSNSPALVWSNQSDTSYDPGPMIYVTIYYWRIIAWDNHSALAVGSLWNFTTRSESNHPPNVPSSPLPRNESISISVNYDISWVGGDSDPGDTVKYDVYFGTSSSPPKKVTNQTSTSYDPGTMSYSTTYYWKIIAWDFQSNSSTSPLFHFKTTVQSGGGEEPPQEPQNIQPIADASAGKLYQGLINSMILFDGSRSYDPDGNITSWFWDFGDNFNANGVSVSHSFLKAGTCTVTLTVTDNKGATDTDTTTCVIRQSNRPPTKPTIAGNISGTKNTVYTYTAASTDPDKDPLLYTFEWGGSISQLSGFLPNGMNYSVNHSWATAGRYNLTVTVTDNQNNSTSMITIYIDAIQTRGAGYLFDNDGDGIYDAFYSDETHQTVSVQKKDDSYLIDKNGDGTWEYVYNATYGLTSYQEPRKTPGYDLVFTLGAIAVVILLSRKRKTL